jgi:hypothetical protein
LNKCYVLSNHYSALCTFFHGISNE